MNMNMQLLKLVYGNFGGVVTFQKYLAVGASLVFSEIGASANHNSNLNPRDSNLYSMAIGDDCTSDERYYYFHGKGEGSTESVATQAAILSGRKHVISCHLGANISFESVTTETNAEVSQTNSAKISISADKIDWSGMEMLNSTQEESNGLTSIDMKFRWKKDSLNKIKARVQSLEAEKERNRRLALKVKEAEEYAKDKDRLLNRKQSEIDQLKRLDKAIANLPTESERILAKLERLKKFRAAKEEQWIKMVTSFGCGVTIRDLEALLGKPAKTEVKGRKIDGRPHEYTPLLYFIYADFAIIAPVSGTTLTDHYNDDWNRVLIPTRARRGPFPM